jgi:hypothetical protein
MSDEPSAQRNPESDIAPPLGDYTNNYRTNELPFHLKRPHR